MLNSVTPDILSFFCASEANIPTHRKTGSVQAPIPEKNTLLSFCATGLLYAGISKFVNNFFRKIIIRYQQSVVQKIVLSQNKSFVYQFF